MQISINRLEINNFKGINDLSIDFKDETRILGDNGTGKTTVADAFFWLLFGKDSQGKADFSIKPLDSSNSEIPMLENTVLGEIVIDGKTVLLKKVMSEKWTQKRGSASKTFQGHETKYFVDDIPVKLNEYKKKVSEICNEDIFKLITDPAAFPALHWKKQREQLFEIIGDIDETSILSDEIHALLDGKTIDERKAQLNAEKKEVNKELKETPIRIKELKNVEMVQEMPEGDKEAIQNLIDGLQARKGAWSNSEIKQKIADLNLEKSDFINDETKKHQDSFKHLVEQKQKLEKANSDLVSDITADEQRLSKAQSKITFNREEIERLTASQQKLREDYAKVYAEMWKGSEDCPTCSQKLPESEIASIKADFENSKANRLQAINAQGKELKQRIEKCDFEIETNTKIVKSINLDSLKKEAAELQKQIDAIVLPEPINPDTSEYDTKIAELRTKLENEEKTAAEEIEKIQAEIDTEKVKIKAIETWEAEQAAYARTLERIEELEKHLDKMTAKFEEIEKYIFMLEEYTKKRVELIESKVNSVFENISFKLFKTNINQGIEDTCEILVNGVPFSSGLNTGSRINAGLEVCKVLQKHHETTAPIFIDNAESVTEFIKLNTQVIKMVVHSGHSVLTVFSN